MNKTPEKGWSPPKQMESVQIEDPKIRDEQAAIQAAIEGQRSYVDFSKCQVERIIDAQARGLVTEFETMGPYMADYNVRTGEIWGNNLANEDAVGIEVARYLKDELPDARMVSLYDEYHVGFIDHSDIYGKPADPNAKIKSPSDTAKKNFRDNLGSLIREKVFDGEESNILLVSESSKIESAKILIELLRSRGFVEQDGKQFFFVNPNAETEETRRFALTTKSGKFNCAALDASSFLSPENRETCHVIVLPEYMRQQQNEVWEILKVLGIQPTNYHNIFFEPDANKERVVEEIRQHFTQKAPQ